MSPLALLFVALGTAAVMWLAVVLLRFNLRRRSVIRCAETASEADLERVYTVVEALGTESPSGYVLARTNRVAPDERLLVPLLGPAAPSPWAGQQVEVTVAKDVVFSLGQTTVAEPQLLGCIYRHVAVPRRLTKSGKKARNVFDPKRYYADSPDLRMALSAICPKFPEDLLAYLLCAGRQSHEFEPIDQARVGNSPAWVQAPEHQICPVCGRRMTMILQLPGTLLSRKAFQCGTFFLFGCDRHPEQTKSLGQFT